MKNLLATAALLASLCAAAQTGEEQERLNQEPPVVTERQVQNDAKKAAELRSDKEKLPNNERELKVQQREDMKANKLDAKRAPKNTEQTPAPAPAKKTSKQPEGNNK